MIPKIWKKGIRSDDKLPFMDHLEELLEREGRRELARECFKALPVMAELDILGYELLFEH